MDLPDEIALELDPNSLTIEDIETVEEYTGLALEEAFEPGRPRGRLLRAMAFVALRKKYPDVTMADVGKVRLGQAQLRALTPEPPTPTGAAG